MISAVRAFLRISSSLNTERYRLGRIWNNGIIIIGDQVGSTQVNEVVIPVGIPFPPCTNHTKIPRRVLKPVRCSGSLISVNPHDIPPERGSPQSPIQNGLIDRKSVV